jgi:hypothetical protein
MWEWIEHCCRPAAAAAADRRAVAAKVARLKREDRFLVFLHLQNGLSRRESRYVAGVCRILEGVSKCPKRDALAVLSEEFSLQK